MKRVSRLCLILLCLTLLVLSVLGSEGRQFPDVAPDSWYGDAVAEMTSAGVLTGYPDGTFKPGNMISGAEFVWVAARCAGLAPVQTQDTYWAAGIMEAAREARWYDWDEMPPAPENYDQPIPRQLAVKVLMKALLPEERGDYALSSQITDFSSLPSRYYDTTFAAYAAEVVKGDGQGAFRPADGLTRAEAVVLFQRALGKRGGALPAVTPAQEETPAPVAPISGGVTENGWLQVVGTQLCNEAGDPILLHGMSSHGLQWYPQFTSKEAIASTAAYGANVFRVAMYTGEDGYLSRPEEIKKRAVAAVDAAVACDMYVVLDWHVLSDGDPMKNIDQAQAFFEEMSQRYGSTPNVLFEVCNEPNGAVTWKDNVKPFVEKMVSVIRANAPKNIILIGSPTWSTDIHLAAKDPVEGENLMYTLHFYAGSHGGALRSRINDVRKAGIPVFISEWGTSRADGSGGVYPEESQVWLDFLEEKGISWCNWSLCDKDETSAALVPGADPKGPWTEKDLSASGKFVFARF